MWVAEERVRGLTTAWKDESPVAAGADAAELNLVDGMVKDGYANFLVPLLKVVPRPCRQAVPCPPGTIREEHLFWLTKCFPLLGSGTP